MCATSCICREVAGMGKKTLQMITPKEALELLKEGKEISIIKEYSLDDE